jgi:DNA polymerase-3 subunit beta
VVIEGDAISIAFNAAYLADGLGAVNASHAQMAFTAPAKPAVISARRDGQTDPSYRYLLMPMRYGN